MAKKKPKEKKKRKPISSLYKIAGDKAERVNPFCPKCGSGHFLALHKDRSTCGKCNYSELVTIN